MRRDLLIAVAMPLILVSPAHADVTVCHGDQDCTVVDTFTGQSRKMTPEELRRKWREQSRDGLYKVECPFADDQSKCEALRRSLMELF